MSESNAVMLFKDLSLPAPVLQAVQDVGYESPTPIQSQTIPPLLDGRDLLGHAPTGTGKTAAFALPILSRIDLDAKGVQALILAPTRELAIQVAEAFATYAKHMKNLRVLPIYGGQDYTGQIRQLNRGVNVVVGTPGRIMDHMRRGTLKLDRLQTLVLDEADEMLRMGFIDDVEWILEQTPAERQMALFSATMPAVIKKIAAKHLTNPAEITIEGRLTTADTIRQRFWLVSGLHKLDALTRILEAETFDAMLVFVRTRTATVEVADKLAARGFIAAAMNGDMPQKQREQMVDKLKKGRLDILVATDVVARGLDVKRISHVINYDIPYDTEAYVHRIGRTGRAGRSGDAILFVTQRERRLLATIERATRQKIEALQLPTIEMVNNKRIADFKQRIADTLATGELAYLVRLCEEFSQEHNVPAERVAAALAKMCMGDQPLVITGRDSAASQRDVSKRKDKTSQRNKQPREDRPARIDSSERQVSEHREKRVSDKTVRQSVEPSEQAPTADTPQIDKSAKPGSRAERRRAEHEADVEMEGFRVEVGREHGVKAENLVGAIANEAGLDAQFIGRIKINEDHSLVELPSGMPKFLLKDLKRVWVCERQLLMSRASDGPASQQTPPRRDRASSNKSQQTKQTERTERTSDDTEPKVTAEQQEKRERKKKERHRNKKNKGKRS